MATRYIAPNLNEFPKYLKTIEQKWGPKLARRFERERFVADKNNASSRDTKPPRYVLSMFPYPSGRLHLGHVRIYTSGDILTRYSKLMSKNDRYTQNYENVIYPMGFDSFGLPAENAARERGLHPATWTNSNIRTMKKQLDELALQFHWRESTSNPSYYKWTQAIFLKLMDAGLVYKSFAQVNWDPVDKTVLADEQVDEEGRSWRSGALVEKRFFRQWFVKVNAFTHDIYYANDINIETWQDILTIQQNWIGKPTGYLFYLPIRNKSSPTEDILPIYTRNPELFKQKTTRLVISKDHWLNTIFKSKEVINPFSLESMEVSLADDTEVLPIGTKATLVGDHICDSHLNREEVLLKAKLNNLGGYYTSSTYRDWLISRQRFWGTPIPVTLCDSCGYQGVSKDQLPVLLPKVTNITEVQETQSMGTRDQLHVIAPIEKLAPRDWIETNCSSCGSPARRECETLDTLFDSSWYFLRYAANPIDSGPFDKNQVQPTWCYIGGKEHASMHLFYARFMTHFLYSLGELPFREPFTNLLVQGVVKSRTYKLHGRYISKAEADSLLDKKNLLVAYEKMSKSKGNGVDPQDLLNEFGVDATRFCLMSYANPKSERLWRTISEEFREVISFMRRLALTLQDYNNIGLSLVDKTERHKVKITELDKPSLAAKVDELIHARNKCSVNVIFNIEEIYQFRQYISDLHVLTATLRSNLGNSSVYTREFADALGSLIVMLNPVVPHFSEEMWSIFSRALINPLRFHSDSRFKVFLQASDQPWPIPDEDHNRSGCFRHAKSSYIN